MCPPPRAAFRIPGSGAPDQASVTKRRGQVSCVERIGARGAGQGRVKEPTPRVG
ncbi:hypothetical protein SGL43_05332 [Streptomyces globisporus]|uniref:Uncharacterized protein n=1 Tax=Streptomyces globisporus TaxID=1908 RepID=A0ABN8V7P5_STRGL|nr:hypothetical protein SGL43_05332 [Streptomyces globisporus]